MPRRRATSFSSSHRASSRRLIAASRLNGPPAVCKGRPCTRARAGVRGDEGRPAMIKTILVTLHGLEPAGAARCLDFSAKMREALRERGRVLLETFTKRCAERGVPCDTTLATGIVANEICDQTRVADLVVIGHRGVNEQFSSGLLGSTTESVTRKSP